MAKVLTYCHFKSHFIVIQYFSPPLVSTPPYHTMLFSCGPLQWTVAVLSFAANESYRTTLKGGGERGYFVRVNWNLKTFVLIYYPKNFNAKSMSQLLLSNIVVLCKWLLRFCHIIAFFFALGVSFPRPPHPLPGLFPSLSFNFSGFSQSNGAEFSLPLLLFQHGFP